MTPIKFLLTALVTVLFSFRSGDENTIKFNYPKNQAAVISMTTDKFQDFKADWRGEDYYYKSENGEDNFICSVLFYKLNKKELKFLNELESQSGVPKGSPMYPMLHFSNSTNTQQYETNEKTWGSPLDDFMFSQVDIKEFAGQKLNQKNMFAYSMFESDLYVKIHLSKVHYSQQDSTTMVQILNSLKKIK